MWLEFSLKKGKGARTLFCSRFAPSNFNPVSTNIIPQIDMTAYSTLLSRLLLCVSFLVATVFGMFFVFIMIQCIWC